jgi:hypothetical protein
VLGGRCLERAEVLAGGGLFTAARTARRHLTALATRALRRSHRGHFRGRPPAVDAAQGRAALELVLAVYRAAAAGGPVALPLDNFSSAAMEASRFGGSFSDGAVLGR